MSYVIIKNPFGSQMIYRENQEGNGVFIPFDEANIDYQTYLNWVNQGNVAEIIDTSISEVIEGE